MHPAVLVFSDFDGTIATKDTGTVIIDKFMGQATRKALDKQILEGEATFRDAVEQMWAAVTASWEEAIDMVDGIPLDPRFGEFHQLCLEHAIPGIDNPARLPHQRGLVPLVRHFIDRYALQSGNDISDIKVLANDAEILSKGWKIHYLDETPHGHDKGQALRDAKAQYGNTNRPLIVFIGDGVSDISAATEADLVFAKRGKDLETWCIRQKIPYTPWDDFSTIVEKLRLILTDLK
eukprot:jgi/Hompol1/2415/HPOL_006019-RA